MTRVAAFHPTGARLVATVAWIPASAMIDQESLRIDENGALCVDCIDTRPLWDGADDDASVERWRADVAAGRTILGWIDWRMDRGAGLTRPFLDISTGHLRESTRALLDETPVAKLPGAVLAGEHGWLVHAGLVDTWPDDLRAAIALAHAQGCDHVLFDRDGVRHPDLPWFGDDAVATREGLSVAST